MIRKIPGMLQLTRENSPRRGISWDCFFADILMFMQLGFRELFDGNVQLHKVRR